VICSNRTKDLLQLDKDFRVQLLLDLETLSNLFTRGDKQSRLLLPHLRFRASDGFTAGLVTLSYNKIG